MCFHDNRYITIGYHIRLSISHTFHCHRRSVAHYIGGSGGIKTNLRTHTKEKPCHTWIQNKLKNSHQRETLSVGKTNSRTHTKENPYQYRE